MKTMINRWLLCLLIAVTHMMHVTQAQEDLEFSYGDEEFISIATGKRELISVAPAVASVITSDDIEALGATDLNEILETVPGLHVSVAASGWNPIFSIRGIYSEFNPQVLVLVNNIPLTNLYVGDRGQVWGGMPVEDIARIEVMRGPGSAVYGADAFSGVINIITKDASNFEGLKVGARIGSFDTSSGWLLYGENDWVNEWDILFSFQLNTKDSYDAVIEADSQSQFDTLLGTSVSNAPGKINSEVQSLDTRIDIANNVWKLRMSYQARRDLGTGAGVAQALDPIGSAAADRLGLDINYQQTNVKDYWDVAATLSYYDVSNKSDLVVFPAGADFSLFGGGYFPDGVIGNPYIYEKHYRFDSSAFYHRYSKHRIRVGVGFNYGDMYKIKETKNFESNPIGIPVPLGSIVDVSNTAPFIREEDRKVFYAFAQDEWAFTADWKLTYGVRFDDYSDFGNTTNPRLALVWQTAYNLTSKFLYGRAFRAPSFAEQFNLNNPVALGNDQLKPEEIDTVEVAFDYAPRTDVRTSLNIFAYEMRDIIRFTPDDAPATSSTAQNTGEQEGYGLEWEIKWSLSEEWRLLANYAFQKSTDEETNTDAPYAPQQQLYARLDWKITPHWRSHFQANRVMDRKRELGDLRPPIEDYTTFDWVLRYDSLNGGFGYSLSARNLFDEDVREPSLAPGLIPNDLPMPGRSFYAELSYRWH